MPKVGRARWTPNPNSKVVRRQLNFNSNRLPPAVQVLKSQLAAGNIGVAAGAGGAVSGNGGAQLTLGDSVITTNNGNIAIKSNNPSNSVISTVTTLN